eukprot:CAMPEP_0196669136 /NCGR_PEP_ID=MMETSP1090-20130531/436_1 /TAXON_ID=37098 /ORGANISM="Isochrysis sp, Strain CCMP1244" /LENGTH=70 /DNA_ID=CAMNT_0042006639 /DNA_START=68 /DNA_END=278 /DNA_ORIENTATION=+
MNTSLKKQSLERDGRHGIARGGGAASSKARVPAEARKASAAGERRGLALAAKGQQSEGREARRGGGQRQA